MFQDFNTTCISPGEWGIWEGVVGVAGGTEEGGIMGRKCDSAFSKYYMF